MGEGAYPNWDKKKKNMKGREQPGNKDNMEYSNVCSRSSKKMGWQVIKEEKRTGYGEDLVNLTAN